MQRYTFFEQYARKTKKSGLPVSNPLYLVIAEGDTSYFVNPTSYLI